MRIVDEYIADCYQRILCKDEIVITLDEKEHDEQLPRLINSIEDFEKQDFVIVQWI